MLLGPTLRPLHERASLRVQVHFVFGSEEGPDSLGPPNEWRQCPFSEHERALSETMRAYWVAFAKFGDPNEAGGGRPQWPAYHSGNVTLRLMDGDVDGEPITAVAGLHAVQCAFWERMFPSDSAPPILV
jgi:carboxylesterase type B